MYVCMSATERVYGATSNVYVSESPHSAPVSASIPAVKKLNSIGIPTSVPRLSVKTSEYD
jgi:hypothetical protein